MQESLNFLIIDDSFADANAIVTHLKSCGYDSDFQIATDRHSLLKAVAEKKWDFIICDYFMPGFTGMDVLAMLKKAGNEAPVIIVSGAMQEETAVASMRAGARDYLMKGNLTRLLPVVQREIDEHRRRKEAEAALVQKEKQVLQAQRIESIARLAGGIAHDFNNILAVISACTESLMSDLPKDQPPHEECNVILDTVKKGADLTRQLLAFSRKQVLKPEVIDINRTIENLKKMLIRVIGEDIELVAELRAEVPHVKADPSQVEQVIMNLVTNARDAMPNGGKITIATDTFIIDQEFARKYQSIQAGPHVMLTISDTGGGMDEETQSRIFEPFFTTKETGKGTGLGLSTVYGIVKQSAGSIWVSSKIGVGSKFTIYLPTTEEPVTEHPVAEPMPPIPQGSVTILLVEDQEMVLRFTARILEKSGYKVLTANSPEDALALVADGKRKVDLLLSDVVMRKMSGPDLAERLKLIQPGVKVLFMTGYADERLIHHGIMSKNTPLLDKPFSTEQLIKKIRQVL